jgi:8-oxo-dGTP diphosphatase
MERNANGIQPRPSVGLGIYIFNEEGKVLLGKRKSSHGSGEYAAPGGHLEFGESFEEGCKKEVKEETDLDIREIEFFDVQNNLRYVETKGKHYVTLSFKAHFFSGTPKVTEPEKCESWDWYSLDALPSPLSEFAEVALAKLRSGIVGEPHSNL